MTTENAVQSIKAFLSTQEKKVLLILDHSKMNDTAIIIQQIQSIKFNSTIVDISKRHDINTRLQTVPFDQPTLFMVINADLDNYYMKYQLERWNAKIIVIVDASLLHPTLDPSIYFAPIKNNRAQKRFLCKIELPSLINHIMPQSIQPTSTQVVAEESDENPSCNDHFLNHNLISHDSLMMQMLADRVRQDELFEDFLFDLIYVSRLEDELKIAAANAITALNYAKTSFAGRTFKGVNIPGADLTSANCDQTDFSEADLTKVNLKKAWLHNTLLRNTKMDGAIFGELPYLLHQEQIFGFCYNPKQKFIALGCKTIQIWSSETFTLLKQLEKSSHEICFSPEGDKLISYDRKKILIWHLVTDTVAEFETDNKNVTCMAVSPNGRWLAFSCEDTSIQFYDLIEDKLSPTLSNGSKLKKSSRSDDSPIIYFVDDENLITGDNEGEVTLWNFVSQNMSPIAIAKLAGKISALTVNPQQNLAAIASCNSEIIISAIYDNLTYKKLPFLHSHVNDLAFSPDGRMLASAHDNKEVCLWDTYAGTLLGVIRGNASYVVGVAFIDSEWLVSCTRSFTTDKRNRVNFWNIAIALNSNAPEICHSAVVNNIYIDALNKFIVSTARNEIGVWSAATGQCLRIFQGHDSEIAHACFHPTSPNIFFTASLVVQAWDIETGKLLKTIINYDGFCNSLAIDIRDELLISGCDNRIDLWNIDTYQQIARTSIKSKVHFFSYNQKLNMLIIGDSHAGLLHLFIVKFNRIIYFATKQDSLQEQMAGINTRRICSKSLCLNPDGTMLAYGDLDGNIIMCDMTYSVVEEILRYRTPAHTQPIVTLNFNNDGSKLISGGYDSIIHLWNVTWEKNANGIKQPTITKVLTLEETHGAIRDVNFKDNDYIATASSDNSVKLWKIVKTNQAYNARLCWRSPYFLFANGAKLDGAIGLSLVNEKILKQQGAEGQPLQEKKALYKLSLSIKPCNII